MKHLVNPLKISLVLITLLFLSACNGGGGGNDKKRTSNTATTNSATPIADAGPDQTVIQGHTVTLNGSSSYAPEGATLTFLWQQTSGESITLSSTSIESPNFIAPNSSQTLSFQLITSDGTNSSLKDTVTITVIEDENNSTDPDNTGEGSSNSEDGSNEGNDSNNSGGETGDNTSGDGENNDPTDPVIGNTAPLANAGEDRDVNAFSLVILDASLSSDPENDTLTYLWQQTSGTAVALNNTTIVSPNFDAPNISETLTFSLIVSDTEFNSEADTVSITIIAQNTPPTASAGQDRTVIGLSQVVLQGTSSYDSEGDSLSYHWQQTSGPEVTLNNPQLANPSFEAPNIDSSLSFSLIVNDGEFNSNISNVTITIESLNTAPTANAGIDQAIQGLSEVYLDGSLSSDPEGDDLTYNWTQVSGSLITLTNPDSASPSFIAPNQDETITFTLIVNDGELDSTSDNMSIIIEKINTPPIAHAGVNRYVSSLSVVALNGALSYDPDDDTITYSWSQLSGPGVELSDTHTIKPIFTANTDGELTFSLTVNDGENDSESDTVKVVVGPIPATNIKVNGTGITWGGSYPRGNNEACIGEAIDQQDCSLGRELTHNDDSDGRVGFSFKKFNNNGVDVGNNASDWQCVQDSVTGLMWEIKSGGNGIIGDEGINDADDRYSWHNSDPASNGGGAGFIDNKGEACSGYNPDNPQTYCNTQAFVERMNKHTWCGFADWRMPTRKELLSIVDYGNSRPMIDNDYFPEVGRVVWTSTSLALGSISAWGVNFESGNSFSFDKRNAGQIRLVRGGYE